MDRQGRGGPPHRRQSSLPASLHRLIILGPSQPSTSTTLEETAGQPALGSRDRQEGPSRNTFAPHARSIASAPVGQQLPSLVLTQAVFDDSEESLEGVESGRRSPSPPSRGSDQDRDAVARPVLSLPSRLPAWGVVRSDPVYYASTFAYSTYTVPPPGPPLPPISWPPPEPPRAPSRRASPDRRDPPPFYSAPQRGPRHSSPPPPPPVAGPSRLQEHFRSAVSSIPRSARPSQSHTAHSSPEAPYPTMSQPIDIPWRRSGDSTHDSGSLSWAPPSRFPPDEREIRPLPSSRPSRCTHSPQVPVERQASGGRHGGPPLAFPDGYVGVGSTAYHVTTLAPLRPATVLSRATGRIPTPGPSAPRPDFPADRRSAAASHGTEGSHRKGKSKAVRHTGAEGSANLLGKRRRRRRGEKEKEGGSSETSEYAYAPKSKKTLIACHFCRARKLRCDGQKPTCGNCVRRGNACTYEPEPRRRGPAKKKEGKDGDKNEDLDLDLARDMDKDKAKRTDRRSHTSESGARAQRARYESTRPADGGEGMSAFASAPAGLGQAASSSFPYTRSAFEPRLSGPMPTYPPGLPYRPPSPSLAYGAAPVAFTFLSVRPGPSRSAAFASAPESGQSSIASAPESTQSSTSNVSAPESVQSSTSASSVPNSEDGTYEDMDYFDYDEFYGHTTHTSPHGRRSQ